METTLENEGRAEVEHRLRSAGCVFAEQEAQLLLCDRPEAGELAEAVQRRVAGEPLEQVLGWAGFCGLRIAVEPGVFVPRRRTEYLVQLAVSHVRALAGAAERPAVVMDLCCGAGAVGAAIAAAEPGVDLHAGDCDTSAVAATRRNLPAGAAVYLSDLDAGMPDALRGSVTVLTANVPYVPTGELELLPPEARCHEPRAALDGGQDGLAMLRRVAACAPRWLAAGGRLLSEVSPAQAPAAIRAFSEAGLATQVAESEELAATVIMGTMPRNLRNDLRADR